VGIAVHAAIGARPAPGLARVTAAVMQTSYGLPADRARELSIAETPAQVTGQLAPYIEAGAQLVAVICDPVPSAGSWELLADVRRLLNQP
jgi:alkanesulfonate monooxygenase SsuD/methylene tetrahydromethanopterin reductase-like flavin-dependent oxidoreductase (luciferase family)